MTKRMKILIGYDGSTYADAALEDLRLAGLPPAGEATVVSVGDVLLSSPLASHELIEKSLPTGRLTPAIELAHKRDAESLVEAHRLADEAARRAREFLPGWEISPKALTGSPSEELLREAQFMDADLIVVGSRGLTALERFFLGSVSKRVASEAGCSVRIARVAEETNRELPARVIVGVDGSAGAASAVRAVGMRAWPEGTEVRLIAVDDGSGPQRMRDIPARLEELVTTSGEGPPVNARLMAEGAHVVLRAQGLNVSVLIREGDPRRVLLEEAEGWKAHSLFIGARGLESETDEPGIGDVSMKLVTATQCSVELVR